MSGRAQTVESRIEEIEFHRRAVSVGFKKNKSNGGRKSDRDHRREAAENVCRHWPARNAGQLIGADQKEQNRCGEHVTEVDCQNGERKAGDMPQPESAFGDDPQRKCEQRQRGADHASMIGGKSWDDQLAGAPGMPKAIAMRHFAFDA